MNDLRRLPKVDALSRAPSLESFPERVRVDAARRAIDEMRQAIQAGASLNGHTPEELALNQAQLIARPSLRPAINLSGVILHTGLGRARLAKAAVERVAEVARSHSFLELDEDSGKRGDRQEHVRALLLQLTGAEDAFVVNNAAAALVLALTALARNQDVVLSRGEMVEIGGSFRMPDIVRESGCSLMEVGCTNKTRLSDYEEVVTPDTGAILRCHTSNFKIIGFTEHPPLQGLVQLARANWIPCIDDMGTGCIVDTSRFGMTKAPTIQDSLNAGADIVTASGDKLLGGPQAGLILGRSEYVDQLKRHPLARAMRVDKLTLAALEATLSLYAQGREAEIPTIAYLSRTEAEVKKLATKLASSNKSSIVEPGITEVGGGAAPGTGLATWRVGLKSNKSEELLGRLREADPSIIGRIEDGHVWLDPRTLDSDEIDIVGEVLRSL